MSGGLGRDLAKGASVRTSGGASVRTSGGASVRTSGGASVRTSGGASVRTSGGEVAREDPGRTRGFSVRCSDGQTAAAAIPVVRAMSGLGLGVAPDGLAEL